MLLDVAFKACSIVVGAVGCAESIVTGELSVFVLNCYKMCAEFQLVAPVVKENAHIRVFRRFIKAFQNG